MRYIQHPETKQLVPAEEYFAPRETTHMVMGDIQPYVSMIDGSVISSRSRHRAHLKAHGCIEVGNETRALMEKVRAPAPPPGRKELLIHLANERLRRK